METVTEKDRNQKCQPCKRTFTFTYTCPNMYDELCKPVLKMFMTSL